MMTKLCSGKGVREDAAADDDDDADQSNTYMSPSRATQKKNTCINTSKLIEPQARV